MKNKLMLSNFNTCQIFVNAIFLLGGFYFLESAYQLYSMILVTSLGLGLNAYVLGWSYKNKIYDADLLFKCNPSQSFIGFMGMSLISSLRPIFYYFVVSSISILFIYLNSLTKTDYEQHAVFFVLLWILIIFAFIVLILGGGLLYLAKTLATTDAMFPTEKAKLVQQFKLNVDDTVFCSSGNEITGFISSGLLYVKDQGLIYNNTTYKPDDVISYLNAANIKLSELDSEHIKVMSMYCYA